MSKKQALVFSLISVLSPALLILLFIINLLTENYFLTRYTSDPFIVPLMLWMIIGWIIGLCTGFIGLVSSIKLKKEHEKVSGSFSISIIGIVLNLLWLFGIINMFPGWMGI